jgi:hypothetical protein
MYSRRYYSRDRELDLDIERAGLRLAQYSNNTALSLLPTYPYYPSYNYLTPYSYPYYGFPNRSFPYYGGYPYGSPYPYLYY